MINILFLLNTGFMLIRNNPDSKAMIELWFDHVFNSKEEVNNDQPPFQEIAKRSEFLSSHRCADENEGIAMWFHKKKISGSGLTKQYYFSNLHLIKVFHANDITSCSKKIEVLKKLKMWYLSDNIDSRATQSNLGSISKPFKFNASKAKSFSFLKTGKFYIYEWPNRITTLIDKVHPWRHENFGAGPILDASSGQFNTYMHSLFPIVFKRLQLHPKRVYDISEAQWIFIPYDITSDAYYNGNSNLNEVLQLLNSSKAFMDSGGINHFFIDSSEPFWYEKKIVVSAFYRFCNYCMKFTPSTLPVPYQKWQHEFSIDKTYVHIPYTSTWHYYESTASKNNKWAWEFDVNQERENLIAFVGIIKKMIPSATQLRRYLVNQCKAATQSVIDKPASSNLVHFQKLCVVKVLGKDTWQNFGNEASIYANSTFCLLPPGDIPSRKAVFDMLLAGCIPVIFNKKQIDLYKWHLSDEEVTGSHYFIAADDVLLSKVNVPSILQSISESLVLSMRTMIKHVAWKLQYALPPLIIDEKTIQSPLKWTPPKVDALEVIVSKLMDGDY